jgi:hypothetical protein
MEVIALAGLLALGYTLTRRSQTEEGFENTEDSLQYGGLPPPIYAVDKTPPGAATIPGKPRQPLPTVSGELDQYYLLPSGGSLPANPTQGKANLFVSPTIIPQAPPTSITSTVRMNTDNSEAMPVYNSGKPIVSALTGLPMPASDFTHNNMVPFYRGSIKQNMSETSSRSILDDHIGAGSTLVSKREQAPLFDPHREPTGNVYGMESITDFVQDRMVAPTSRAFEKPVESVLVAPGLDEGFSSFGKGGFQQFEMNEILRQRKTVDELRVDSNPKVSYEMPIIPGTSIALQRGDIGETRKYRPDKFFINQDGERNFTTVSENSRPTERAAQVMKYQSRQDTSTEVIGPAAASDFSATYTVPSFRAPLVRQQDGYGYRNADGSTYGTQNTDAENNDYGRSGVELFTNQRNVTSERGQGLNLRRAGVPGAMTVYDPMDVARTTVRETTGANDYSGIAGPGGAAQKLTVYDPSDITRVTTRNTNSEPDRAMNVSRAGMPGLSTLQFPDGVRDTTKAHISANSAYTGSSGKGAVNYEQSYDYAYDMRTNPNKEVVAQGRTPISGNGSLPLFNGEDNMNITYRRLDTDALNDRGNATNRVVGPPLGVEAIGLQRPRNVLALDISRDRNIREIIDSLSDNPYALNINKITQEGGRIIR